VSRIGDPVAVDEGVLAIDPSGNRVLLTSAGERQR
jgi:hypothetical protein